MLLKILILFYLIVKIQCANLNINEDFSNVNISPECTVMGRQNTTWNGEVFHSFRGIPFVKPPLGELRFKDPQPLEALPESIDARFDGHDCPSIYSTNGSENCLNLNVYTKNLTPHSPLPVIAFIHPGGLYIGSGLSSFIGPEYLLTKDIVVVTFNYRLGTLGFLNLGTEDVPGNAGFKDQVHALRWIQKYIVFFGGNPNDVTLMGYSAGGLSISLHLVSPMSRGLFHKAVIMSGSQPSQTILPKGHQLKLAKKQAELLNCSGDELSSEESIVKCLNRFSGKEIAATLRGLYDFGMDNPIYLWWPVLEKDFGQERFLTEDFYTSLKEGRFHKVPLLIGYTDGEFCTSAANVIRNEELKNRFLMKFEELAPKVFMYEGRSNLNEINSSLRKHYVTEDLDLAKLCNLFSDAIIRFGAQRLLNLTSPFVPAFSYKFTYRGEFTNLHFDTKTDRVEHMDDLMYLFQMAPHHFVNNDKDAKMVELYVNFIYDFVTNGTIFHDDLLSPSSSENYFLIAQKLEHKNGSNFEEYKLWDQLFPL